MLDSHTAEAVTSSKLEYENAISVSQHAPQAKAISEMVLDAFQTAKESEQIRLLRAAIRQAQDQFDDDKAYELMGELKQLKDAEAADSAALADLGSRFPISRILASYKDDPTFQELVYSLALKVLNQTHQAVSNPGTGKSKAARAKKDSEVFTISKDGASVSLPLRTPRTKANVDREAFEFLGFAFIGEGDEAELQSETFIDNEGAEQPATRKNIITALQQQKAFEGYSLA
jgi:outer membrane PBP1 activator LpoA protein